jgi:hypothetical protein
MAAAPDRAIHVAYGLEEVIRTPEFRVETDRRAAEILREDGREAPPGRAIELFMMSDGFVTTPEDEAEQQRPLQSVGNFLIDRTASSDGRIATTGSRRCRSRRNWSR